MARAAAVVLLITLGCHDGLRLARGMSNARPYGQLRRRRGVNRTTSFIASPSSPSTRGRERSMAPASSIARAPRSVAHWVRPQARRHYSERPWESEPLSKDGGSCTADEAGTISDKEAGTIGGLALPLGVNRASRITTVRVENLAMVDSVSIEVRNM